MWTFAGCNINIVHDELAVMVDFQLGFDWYDVVFWRGVFIEFDFLHNMVGSNTTILSKLVSFVCATVRWISGSFGRPTCLSFNGFCGVIRSSILSFVFRRFRCIIRPGLFVATTRIVLSSQGVAVASRFRLVGRRSVELHVASKRRHISSGD